MASVHQRYKVIEKLDVGGMAEIYKGKAVSLEGFEKIVAIKRVLPSLTRNQKFVSMFLDEARLAMRLNHANIVQVFDIGRADGTYFIVMDLVEGLNLRRLFQKAVDAGIRIPVHIACYIVMEVCKGLQHAHELTDAEGRPLRIVHRDISPPNVLISKAGEVKVTDFGLAKATTQLESTDPGTVKGKFSYLAPEATEGKEVDARADIFACGVLLYELLTGRRLFLGATDIETIELVRKAEVPPIAAINSDVRPELEEVVRKSLARDPRRRYASARAFEDALAGYLFANGLKVTSSDLAQFLRDVIERREDHVEGPRIEKLIEDEILNLSMVGRLDPSGPGNRPISPEQLKMRGQARLKLDDLFADLTGVQAGVSEQATATGLGIDGLADRLEGLGGTQRRPTSPGKSAPEGKAAKGTSGGAGGSNWLPWAVAGAVAVAAAIALVVLLGQPQ